MKTFKKSGIEIRFRVCGNNAPIYLLLHGFGGGPADFQEIVGGLSENHCVIVPSLKSFFSSVEPITFSQQVEILNDFIHYLISGQGEDSLRIMGHSYGATLSLGVRATSEFKVVQHTLVNPMPFHPLEKLRHRYLKSVVDAHPNLKNFRQLWETPEGQKNMIEVIKMFRVGGTSQQHEVHHFNSRKIALVEKAMERFWWVDSNEPWANWEKKVTLLPTHSITKFLFSNEDPLFSADEYEKFARIVGADQPTSIHHNGHLLVQDRPSDVLKEVFSTKLPAK